MTRLAALARWLARWIYRIIARRWPGDDSRIRERIPDLADEQRVDWLVQLEDIWTSNTYDRSREET